MTLDANWQARNVYTTTSDHVEVIGGELGGKMTRKIRERGRALALGMAAKCGGLKLADTAFMLAATRESFSAWPSLESALGELYGVDAASNFRKSYLRKCAVISRVRARMINRSVRFGARFLSIIVLLSSGSLIIAWFAQASFLDAFTTLIMAIAMSILLWSTMRRYLRIRVRLWSAPIVVAFLLLLTAAGLAYRRGRLDIGTSVDVVSWMGRIEQSITFSAALLAGMGLTNFFQGIYFFKAIQEFDRRSPGPSLIFHLSRGISLATSLKYDTPVNDARISLVHIISQSSKLIRKELLESMHVETARVEERFSSAASRLDDLREWVALPQKGTRENLVIELGRYLAPILTGHLHYLPQASSPPTKCDKSKRKPSRSLRTFIGGLIPIGVISAVYIFEVPLADSYKGVGLAIAIIWFTVTTITVIDARYRETISGMREFVSAMRGAGAEQGTVPSMKGQ